MWHVWERGKVRTGFWLGALRESNRLKGLGVAGRIILKFFFKTCVWGNGLDCSGSGQGQMGGACESGNEF